MDQPAPPPTIAELFHHRWNAPTLVALLDTGSSRVVVLVNKLGVSRNALKAALGALDEMGLAVRNPGYGHPLRPEIILTARGKRVGPACRTLAEVLGDDDLLARKWTAPVLLALAETQHFNALEQRLDVTPRALSSALRGLVEAGLVARSVDDGRPPRSSYELTESGRRASAAAAAIADALSTPD